MIFCIFSYNRAVHLAHCIQSINICCEAAEIWIFDDNSDDPKTLDVLLEAKKSHKVILPEKPRTAQSKHGGLYTNMQRALELLPSNRTVCFLQDDTQCVRKFTRAEQQSIDTFFAQNPHHTFIHPALLRLINKDRDSACMQWHDHLNGYIRNSSKQSAGVFYSDIFISQTSRLKDVNWHFQNRESANERQAKEIFKPLVFMKNPFIMWRPYVTVYRGKQKTWALQYAEKIRNSGFHPISIMNTEQNESFINRAPAELPFAERYLTTQSDKVKVPWYYHPLERNRTLTHLNKIELLLNRLFNKLKAPLQTKKG